MEIYYSIRRLEDRIPDLKDDADWKKLKLFLEPYDYLHRDDVVQKNECSRSTRVVVGELRQLWPDLIRMLDEYANRGEWVSHDTFQNAPIVMAKFLLAIRVHHWYNGCFGGSVEEEYLKLLEDKEE